MWNYCRHLVLVKALLWYSTICFHIHHYRGMTYKCLIMEQEKEMYQKHNLGMKKKLWKPLFSQDLLILMLYFTNLFYCIPFTMLTRHITKNVSYQYISHLNSAHYNPLRRCCEPGDRLKCRFYSFSRFYCQSLIILISTDLALQNLRSLHTPFGGAET